MATFQDAFDAAAKESGKSPRDVEFTRAFYTRLLPGIDAQFDGPAMLPLIAPTSAAGDQRGFRRQPRPSPECGCQSRGAKPAYAAAGAPDKIQLIIEENTPHRVNPEAIDAGIAWFVRWLKP